MRSLKDKKTRTFSFYRFANGTELVVPSKLVYCTPHRGKRKPNVGAIQPDLKTRDVIAGLKKYTAMLICCYSCT